jgi:hypothetical protein
MKSESCSCAEPVRIERAERKGAAWSECARCRLPITATLLPRLARS